MSNKNNHFLYFFVVLAAVFLLTAIPGAGAEAIRAKDLRIPKSNFAPIQSKSIFAMDSQQKVREALKCAIGITGKGVPIKGVNVCFEKTSGAGCADDAINRDGTINTGGTINLSKGSIHKLCVDTKSYRPSTSKPLDLIQDGTRYKYKEGGIKVRCWERAY